MRTGSAVIPRHVPQESKWTIVAKEHEDLAAVVETQLRETFQRVNLWVIPYDQLNKENKRYPCLRVIDGTNPSTDFDNPAVSKVKELAALIYGDADVYVSVEDISIMPEGDGLKYVMDHLMALRYGHRDYAVEYDRDSDNSPKVTVEIMNFGVDEDFEEDREGMTNIPNQVILYVFEKSRELRPDIIFSLLSDVTPEDKPPTYAPGFKPV